MFFSIVLSLVPALASQGPIPVREVLAVEALGVRRRSAVYTDALEAELARGAWSAPEQGDTILSATGDERTWTHYEAQEDGWFSGPVFRGGWAFATVDVPSSGPWRLDASGHSYALVDGEPHMGDVYRLGLTRTPLALDAGRHELLFRCGRGSLRATLEPAPGVVYLEEKDRTVPDVIRGEGGRLELGLIVSNAGLEDAGGYSVRATAKGAAGTRTPVPGLLSSSYRKCAVGVEVPSQVEGDGLEVELELLDPDGAVVHTSSLTLGVRDANQKHARSFVSTIDGSVQYFAVTPPTWAPSPSAPGGEPAGTDTSPTTPGGEARPALFLSLHGAGVEGRNQAYSYAPKDWGVVVAPTNRRPYGFDWEDWGRLDALEVLEVAERLFDTDPRRTYLTGHSMGGHGTWQIGAHFPDRFAAIAPSAGWRDFWGYGGGVALDGDDRVGALLSRAANASRTLLLERNYLHGGVYVLHGSRDENVPVSEARAMRERLATFHPNFAYYERPGAGHWWGNQCMDWPPLFDFLRQNELPEPAAVREVEFVTVNPGISSRCDWVTLEAQGRWMAPSRVRARLDVAKRTVDLELENVTRLSIDLAVFAARRGDQEPPLALGEPIQIRIGEQELTCDFGTTAALVFDRGGDGLWRPLPRAPRAWAKGPHRAGPFKDAFRHRMVFVYGTNGSAQENAWCLAKARLDHETWRYRGNGSVDVIADVDFRPLDHPDRGVILYGNQDTNAAWEGVLGAPPFELSRGRLRVGDHVLEGDDLALLAVYPRAGSDVACVAVVGGTGLPGCHTTDHLPYFVSGVAYPDWTVLGTEFLLEGLAGVRGAGYFRSDWATEEGAEAVWR